MGGRLLVRRTTKATILQNLNVKLARMCLVADYHLKAPAYKEPVNNPGIPCRW